jgi:hypothetical protein
MAPAPSAVVDLSAAINSPRLEPRVRELYESNKVDVDGEALFTISVLLLLNAINATQRQPEDLSRLNRSRQKQRKRPLMGYETVLMRLSRPERTSGGSTGTGHGGPKTAHICRGHYKRLVRPGKAPRLVWWRYHWRGGGPRQSADRTREVTL